MNVTTVTEARSVCEKLKHDLSEIHYNPDLHKMLKNIENMVTELSKLEVVCRRTKSMTLMEDTLAQINSSMKHLDGLILMARIMD